MLARAAVASFVDEQAREPRAAAALAESLAQRAREMQKRDERAASAALAQPATPPGLQTPPSQHPVGSYQAGRAIIDALRPDRDMTITIRNALLQSGF